MSSKDRRNGFVLFAAISLPVLGLSQLGSYLVTSLIPVGDTVVVNDFLHLTHIRNRGGIFGVFQGQGWMFGLISLTLIGALILYLAKGREVHRFEFICFAFIAGGGGSNILDRLIYDSVVDFINLQGIPYWHYVFNTADMMVHVGLWPLLIMSLRQPAR